MKTKMMSAAGLITVAALIVGGFGLPASAADPVVIDHGHVDMFNLELQGDNGIRLVVKEDVTGQHVIREAEDVQFVVKPEAWTTGAPASSVPEGVNVADGFAYLPLAQNYNLLWPGWDSLPLQSRFGSNLTAKIRITKVEGPGQIALWSTGIFGGIKSLLDDDAYTLPGTITQTMAAHVHANWAFTAPGTYKLTVQADVTGTDGTKATSNEAVYTIVVKPVAKSLTITGAENPVQAGSSVRLEASFDPADAAGVPISWETKAVDGDWTAASANDDGSLNVTAAEGLQVRASVPAGTEVMTGARTVSAEPVSITIAAPETTAPETSAPETSAPSAPETTALETSALETSAPVTTAPSAPETTAPETSAPETSASKTTAPKTTAPKTTAPVTTAPATNSVQQAESSSSTPSSSVTPVKKTKAGKLPATGVSTPFAGLIGLSLAAGIVVALRRK